MGAKSRLPGIATPSGGCDRASARAPVPRQVEPVSLVHRWREETPRASRTLGKVAGAEIASLARLTFCRSIAYGPNSTLKAVRALRMQPDFGGFHENSGNLSVGPSPKKTGD